MGTPRVDEWGDLIVEVYEGGDGCASELTITMDEKALCGLIESINKYKSNAKDETEQKRN